MLDEQYRLIIKKNICNLEGKPSEIDDYLKSLMYSQNPGEATEYAWEIINKMYEQENLLSLSDYGLVPPGSDNNDFPPEEGFSPEDEPSYDKDDEEEDGNDDDSSDEDEDEDIDSDEDESEGDNGEEDDDSDDTDDTDDEDDSNDEDEDSGEDDEEENDSDDDEDESEGDTDDDSDDEEDDSEDKEDGNNSDGDREEEPEGNADNGKPENPDDDTDEQVEPSGVELVPVEVPVVKSSRVKKEMKSAKASSKKEAKSEMIAEEKHTEEPVEKISVKEIPIQTSDKEFIIRVPEDVKDVVNQGPIYLLPADTGKDAEFRVIQLRVATDENLQEARRIHKEIMQALEAEKHIRDNIFAQLQAFKSLSEQLSENVEQASEIRQMLLDGTTRAERFLNNDMLRLLQQRAQEATNEFYQESRDHYNDLFRAAVKRYKQFTQAAMEFQDKMMDDNDKTLRNIQSRVDMIQKVVYFLCVIVLIILGLTVVFKVF